MAENSARVAKMARFLAITQILTGVLQFSFGIADRVVPGGFTGYGYLGVWIGIWVSNIFPLLKMIKLVKSVEKASDTDAFLFYRNNFIRTLGS